jgi:sulfite exporter TauE/SafE
MNDYTLIFSLISLGFFGGFTHCVGMCGPFVLTQVGNRLKKTSLQNFTAFQRLKNLALLPYHLGRITTYSIIGFFCSFLTSNIQDFISFKIFSALFLFGASIIFLNLFLNNKLISSIIFKKIRKKIILPFKSKILENAPYFLAKKTSILFQNPQGFKGYILGVVLGFIPCGLLYAAFLVAAAIANPFLAAIGMLFFGISTFPSLFLTALGGNVFTKIPEFKFIAKALILLNAIMLFLMAIKLIFKT